MSLPIVDLAPATISYSGGTKELQTVMSVTVDEKDPKTIVKTMNRKRKAIGFTRGVPDVELTVTCVQIVGVPEVDWSALLKSGEEFMFSYEEGLGGQRYNVSPCTVSEVSKPFKEDGVVVFNVKIIAIEERQGRPL